MNFNSRVAKIGKGKCVNGYKEANGNICLYIAGSGVVKKHLIDSGAGYELKVDEFSSGYSEILKIDNTTFVCRAESNIKVKLSDE